ncbi:MAG TPA: hypothetical protein PK395_00985 [bacterium]|nr:hypothetical protein [bacterium]HQP97229.1 hypothetical protein [bacterium]
MIHREDIDPWISVIKPDGHIVEREYGHLDNAFRGLEREGRVRILLDLSEVRFLDRKSIILLLRQNRKVLAKGGAVRLLRPTVAAEASLKSAQVTHLFESFRQFRDAVRSFGPSPESPAEPGKSSESQGVRDLDRPHREALMQQSTISMLIAMLEDKGIIEPGKMGARCAVEAEQIFQALRQRVLSSESQ